MKFKPTSIRAKLGLVLIAGIVPAVLLVSLAAAWRETTRRVEETQSELFGIAEALAATIANPMANDRQQDVILALRAIGRMPAIRYARVVDVRDAPIAQFGVGIVLTENGATTTELARTSVTEALRLRNYAFSVPVISGGTRIGRLELVADVSKLSFAFRSAVEYAVIFALLAAALGLLIAIPMISVVTEPIRFLTQAMRRVHLTDSLGEVPPSRTNDETAVLVAAFNEMLAKLRDRDERLAQHRAGLERAVEERTAELHVAKQVAEKANAAKGDFLATMSHEIRTPLHGLMVTTELLQTTSLDDRQRRFAEIITKSGRSLLTIVNDILDLSKIETGHMELESLPVEPAAVASDVAALFADRAHAKGLQLEVNCAPDVPRWIAADPVRLNQILSNLVGNAIKFTSSGRIDISLSVAPKGAADAGSLRLAVADTGIGIPPASLGRIFDAFAQADGSISRQFGGTGIGLSICRKLAGMMGGVLTVESQVSHGSTFTCSIPITPAEPPTELVASQQSQASVRLDGLRVLAADDNVVNRTVLEAALGSAGARIVSVEDGEAAVATFQRQHFDIVYMDCSMPVLDGYEATRRIRAWEQEQQRAPTPIVALTAHVIGAGASQWRDAGMSDCLTKPFTLDGLLQNIARWSTATTDAAPSTGDAGKVAEHAEDPLDREVVSQLLAIDQDGTFIGRLVRIYGMQGLDILGKLGTATDANDIKAVAAQAHAFKSISLSIGARGAAGIAAEIEERAVSGTTATFTEQMGRLATAFQSAQAALDIVQAAHEQKRRPALSA